MGADIRSLLQLGELARPGNRRNNYVVPLSSSYQTSQLAEVVEELLGGGLLGHLEDLDLGGGHRSGERLEELRQRIHLADALHLL